MGRGNQTLRAQDLTSISTVEGTVRHRSKRAKLKYSRKLDIEATGAVVAKKGKGSNDLTPEGPREQDESTSSKQRRNLKTGGDSNDSIDQHHPGPAVLGGNIQESTADARREEKRKRKRKRKEGSALDDGTTSSAPDRSSSAQESPAQHDHVPHEEKPRKRKKKTSGNVTGAEGTHSQTQPVRQELLRSKTTSVNNAGEGNRERERERADVSGKGDTETADAVQTPVHLERKPSVYRCKKSITNAVRDDTIGYIEEFSDASEHNENGGLVVQVGEAEKESSDTTGFTKARKAEQGQALRGSKRHPDDDPRMDQTLFVGNISQDAVQKDIKKLFRKYGKIESVRIRGVIPANPLIPKKAAFLTNRLAPFSDSLQAYVVFAATEDVSESMSRACQELNMSIFKDRHIRVMPASHQQNGSRRQSLFLGNLPFNCSEEDIIRAFQDVAAKLGVQVIGARVNRDVETGVGRGIGFVSFNDVLGVQGCMNSEGDITIGGRVIRMEPADKKKKLNTKTYKRQLKSQGKSTQPYQNRLSGPGHSKGSAPYDWHSARRGKRE